MPCPSSIPAPDGAADTALKALRSEIDALDAQLAALLKQRMTIIHQVSALKRTHTPAHCHIRPGREGQMHQQIYQSFDGGDFPPAAALSVWRTIIGASTHLESPMTIGAPASHPDLRWFGREYFGRLAHSCQYASTKDMLQATEAGNATIGLLPAIHDTSADDMAALLQHPSLKIFASLPVVLAASEAPSCYALAAITPEPSGHDISLFALAKAADTQALPAAAQLLATGQLYTLWQAEGVHSTHPAYIGSFPRPLCDNTLHPW